jgi:hypothetical protein
MTTTSGQAIGTDWLGCSWVGRECGISGTFEYERWYLHTHTHHIVSLFACMATALCYYYRRVYIRARD